MLNNQMVFSTLLKDGFTEGAADFHRTIDSLSIRRYFCYYFLSTRSLILVSFTLLYSRLFCKLRNAIRSYGLAYDLLVQV